MTGKREGKKEDKGRKISFKRKIGENMPEMTAELIMRSASHGIAELVANSYDADAENVHMTYSPNKDILIVDDDGSGMEPGEVQNFYGIGDSPKLRNPISPGKKRQRLGHFGVATLVLKSLANEYTLTTRRKGLETVVTERFHPDKPLTTHKRIDGKVTKAPRNEHGTTIEMKGLRFGEGTGFSTAVLRRKIQGQFRRLTQLPDFNVYLNTEKIKPSAFENAVKFNVDMKGKYMGHVTGTVYLTPTGTEMRGIHVSVKGRSHGNPQETLGKLSDRGSMKRRVIGDIEADGLAGAVLIDRDTFWEDDKGYQEFLSKMREVILDVDRYERKHHESKRGDIVKESRGDMVKSVRKKMLDANIPGINEKTEFRFGDIKTAGAAACEHDGKKNCFVFYDGIGEMDPEICLDRATYQQAMLNAVFEAIAIKSASESTDYPLDIFLSARADLWKKTMGNRKPSVARTRIYPKIIYSVPELAANSRLPLGVVRYMDDGGLFERVEDGIVGESFTDAIEGCKGFVSLYQFVYNIVRHENITQTMDRCTEFLEEMDKEVSPFIVDFSAGKRGEHCYFVEKTCESRFREIFHPDTMRATRSRMKDAILELKRKSYTIDEIVEMSDGLSQAEAKKVIQYAEGNSIQVRMDKGFNYGEFIDALQQRRLG